MDVAIYGPDLYISQYDANNSAVAVLKASDLSLEQTLFTGFAHSSTAADSGYSGIDITSNGRIFVADQLYSGRGTATACRILLGRASACPCHRAAARYRPVGLVLLGGGPGRLSVTVLPKIKAGPPGPWLFLPYGLRGVFL